MPHRRPRIIVGLLAGSLGLALAPVSSGPADAVPTLSAVTIVSGLSHPWDLTWVGSLMLYNTRNGQVWSKSGSANPQRVDLPGLEASTFAQGEGGLLGMVADPAAATNRRFYTCGATKNGSGAAVDVRVRRWSMTSDVAAVSEGNVIVGLPLTSGRHSGCRLRFGDDGKLYVGTGDAAQGTNPQDLDSLGGKVLRVNSDGTDTHRQPIRQPHRQRPVTSGRTGTATSRVWPCDPAPRSCGRPSTDPAATTRSTSSREARTTAGTRSPGTTRPGR